jgi:hypothetical protein
MGRSVNTFFFFVFLAFILVLDIRCAQDNVLSNDDETLRIDSISPETGVIGTQVRIYGHGFMLPSDQNTVTINGVSVPVDTASVGSILVTVTANTSTGPVAVETSNGEAVGPTFTLIAPPTATAIQPTQGQAGTTVTITGTGFDQVTSVLFNGVTAQITQRSDTQLVVKAPNSSTGTITLTFNGGTSTGPVFTYLKTPVVQNVDIVYTRTVYLHISGINFGTNASTVKVFVQGQEVNVVSEQLTPEPSQVWIVAPDRASPNPFQIVVETNGIKSAPYIFTMPPNIYSFTFTPISTVGNDIVYGFQINGEYFGNFDNNRSVLLKTSTNQVIATTITTWEPEQITGTFVHTSNALGPNDFYLISVIVNGLASNEEQFRP